MSGSQTSFEDSRRLTGPNLFFRDCGAVMEVGVSEALPPGVLARWEARVRGMRAILGWVDGPVVVRPHRTGTSLAFSAPEDQLFTATELNEWAWLVEICGIESEAEHLPHGPGHPSPCDSESAAHTLRHLAAAEAIPAAMLLVQEAHRRGLPTFLSEDALSIGAGTGSRTWPTDDLPEPSAVPWQELHDIPTVLVTGSNGKTTTVRLISAFCAAHGEVPGYNCTDGVFLGNAWVERGDYSGPMGARQVLRERIVQVAVLETARGGLLRRGAVVRRANAAIVTNISPDHFGEYGIHDLEGLAEAKLVVARAMGPEGLLVLNADDPSLASSVGGIPNPLAWFALDHDHPRLQAHRTFGGSTCGVSGGHLLLHHQGANHDFGAIAAMPLTVEGTAAYNIANIAGAALMGSALGLPPATMAEVLSTFGSNREDNPGRLERWNLGGLGILLDYAHNPEGLEGLLAVGRALIMRGRLGLLLGQAGNREDDDIRALARVAAAARPDQVVLKDLDGYLRGREPGEVPALLKAELIHEGLEEDRLVTVLSEVEAAFALLAWAQPGDVLVLPVHALTARERVGDWLDRLAARGWVPGDALNDEAIAPGESD